jgi:hypothetical protein
MIRPNHMGQKGQGHRKTGSLQRDPLRQIRQTDR